MKRTRSGLSQRVSAQAPEPGCSDRWQMQGILVAASALLFVSNVAFGQTTRTAPSATSTSPTMPRALSTSANSPCAVSNPTSPCYTAKAPRNPCYNAAAPNGSCLATSTPDSQNSPTSSVPATQPLPATVRAFTKDQAKAQIEANGYSNVSNLTKDNEGNWHATAEKDGLLQNLTLDREANVTVNGSFEAPHLPPPKATDP